MEALSEPLASLIDMVVSVVVATNPMALKLLTSTLGVLVNSSALDIPQTTVETIAITTMTLVSSRYQGCLVVMVL